MWKLITKSRSPFDSTVNFLAFLAALLIVFAMLIVIFEVVMRYFFRNPQGWVIEIAEYSIVFFTFLGVTWVLREEKHVTMELIVNRLKPRSRVMLGIITSILSLYDQRAILPLQQRVLPAGLALLSKYPALVHS